MKKLNDAKLLEDINELEYICKQEKYTEECKRKSNMVR